MGLHPFKDKLDEDSQGQLDRRVDSGLSALYTHSGAVNDAELGEDAETFAKDTISDILTALFGPAGAWSLDGDKITFDPFATNEARRIIEESMESWLGDAEDYIEKSTAEGEPDTYDIVRHRQGQEREIMETGLSLEEARAHCQRDDTRGEGWFDGYDRHEH